MTHAVGVLTHHVHLPMVAQHQVVIHVDRSAQRVLDWDCRILDRSGRERIEDIVKGLVTDGLDFDARGQEGLEGRALAVRARLALVGHARHLLLWRHRRQLRRRNLGVGTEPPAVEIEQATSGALILHARCGT